jgi:hypothetical protein
VANGAGALEHPQKFFALQHVSPIELAAARSTALLTSSRLPLSRKRPSSANFNGG